MQLEFKNEHNVCFLDTEPDVYTNLSFETVVLLRMPAYPELLRLWVEFQREVMSLLGDLWSMTNGEITDRWGNLGFADGFDPNEPFGFRKVCKNPPRFAFLKEAAVVEALVDIGEASARTVHGRPRQVLRKAQGTLANIIESLPLEKQISVIHSVTRNNLDLEWVLKTSQHADVGIWKVDDLFGANTEPADALGALANAAEASLKATSRRRDNDQQDERNTIVYAPVWFSHYLVARGVWVWPIGIAHALRARYPQNLLPLAHLISVPEHRRNLAEQILSLSTSGRGTANESATTAFLFTTFASNFWSAREFAPGCLAEMKKWMLTYGGSSVHLSGGINRVYQLATRQYNIDFAKTPFHPVFTTGQRIADNGVDIFDWCLNPTHRNTEKAAACLGENIVTIPDHIRNWALYLRDALTLLRVESLSVQVTVCNAWLIYLLTLPELDAPLDFVEVIRAKHVNDGTTHSSANTFVGFLEANRHVFGQNVHERAISQLANLWTCVAKRDGFISVGSCPFDPRSDAKRKSTPGLYRTARPAMDQKVRSIIAEENRKGDYAFARSGLAGKHYYTVIADGETKAETVFWPAVPIIIDFILHSAARNTTVRWLDSGEGDEFSIDIDTLLEFRNTSPLSEVGRREGVLRLFKLGPAGRQVALGMFFNTDKILDSHEVAYIAPHLPAAVRHMVQLQQRYNPMRSTIIPKDPESGKQRLALDRKRPTYPLFRLPDLRRIYPPSHSSTMSYWRSLLQHCQPLVDKELGYSYPLIDDDGLAIFDMHSMRVSTVTSMFNNKEEHPTVQDVTGHVSSGMVAYYRARSDERVHNAMMRLFESRKTVVEQAAVGSPDALAKLAGEAVHIRSDNSVDADRVMKFADDQIGHLDFFAHGVCVCGSCSTGGKRLSGRKFGPVWRHRACSECRHRLSGPRFLGGLISRYNALAMECQLSSKRDAETNRRIRQLEDRGEPVAHLRTATRKNMELRAAIAREMQAESEVIARCVAMLNGEHADVDGKTLVAAGRDEADTEIAVRLEEMHELELAHRILTDTKIVSASELEIPPGTEELLQRGLLKIIEVNGMKNILAENSAKRENEILGLFGDLLFGRGADPAQVELLLDGNANQRQLIQIEDALRGQKPSGKIVDERSNKGRAV